MVSRVYFYYLNKLATLLVISGAVLSLAACDLAENYTKADRNTGSEAQDYRDALAPRLPEDASNSRSAMANAIPDLEPYIAMTSADMKTMPLVSITVNQSVPLRDILYELAEQADYDLELDPSIRGSIIFTARNKPFDQVVERIAAVAGLRYKFEEGFLRVEKDMPYLKTYKVDYLSFVRTNRGDVSTNVSVVSEDGDGASTGSRYNSSSENTADFWGELEVNLAQILNGSDIASLRTARDPRINAVARNPDVAAVSPPDREGDGVNVQPPDAVLTVESLPVDDLDDVPAAAQASNFSINKQAGMITVYGTEKGHKEIKAYLDELRTSVTAQVLIEAKVFEVSLFDEYINGVEWSSFSDKFQFGFLNVASGSLLSGVVSTQGGEVAANANAFARYASGDVGAFVEAISGFGTVHALASPRLTVLNNQAAVLNVATNRIYFDLDLEEEDATDNTPRRLQITTEIKSVPEGVLINVQPSINLADRTVSMLVRPTITRIVNRVQDPSVAFIASSFAGVNITSDVPEVNIQEIDTVIKVNSGQPIVMGGLLQDKAESANEGVPILSEIPMIGNAFKRKQDSITKTELVIFLKATIIDNGNETIHNTDRDLYKQFSNDRRPFDL